MATNRTVQATCSLANTSASASQAQATGNITEKKAYERWCGKTAAQPLRPCASVRCLSPRPLQGKHRRLGYDVSAYNAESVEYVVVCVYHASRCRQMCRMALANCGELTSESFAAPWRKEGPPRHAANAPSRASAQPDASVGHHLRYCRPTTAPMSVEHTVPRVDDTDIAEHMMGKGRRCKPTPHATDLSAMMPTFDATSRTTRWNTTLTDAGMKQTRSRPEQQQPTATMR